MRQVIPEKLIDRCQSGEASAQMELYSMLFGSVYSSALRITRDSVSAQEIAQDSFLKIFRDINRYRDRLDLVVRRIAINASIDLLRRRKVIFVEFSSLCDVDNHDQEPLDDELPDTVYHDIESIKRSIDALPTGYRLVITLRLIDELSFDEIAAQMDITSSTARSQFTRARRKLIEIIKQR